MKNNCLVLIASCWLIPVVATAQRFETDVAPLIEESCLHCHDADTETRLNFETLDYDLTDPKTFRQWENIFDRLQDGEMPPPSEERPDGTQVKRAMVSLERDLREANQALQQAVGRVPLRRLTRSEYENTICDLLLIHQKLGNVLPDESVSAGFDTVGTAQGISAVHIQSYMDAADQAIDLAINLGPRPSNEPAVLDYHSNEFVKGYIEEPFKLGGDLGRKLFDEVAFFIDQDYPFKSKAMGLQIPYPGLYRISIPARAYQSSESVAFTLNLDGNSRGLKYLIGAYELPAGQPPRTVEAITYMTPGDAFFPSVSDLVYPLEGGFRGTRGNMGGRYYEGAGVAMGAAIVEGPLEETWPPTSTRRLLSGIEFVEQESDEVPADDSPKNDSPENIALVGGPFEIKLTKAPIEHVTEIVARLAPLALRRPPLPGEVEGFAEQARPALDEGRDFLDALHLPLRALLSSPQFLYLGGEPGELDDYALASRLSYFLWKSMPDAELFQLADEGALSDPQRLADQVERMLDDEKSGRFVRDFVGQWLGLHDIDTTTPDEILYPEFNAVLRAAMLRETEAFVAELIKEDLPVRNIIDSDFAVLNHRIAKHYGITDVEGEQFRRVALPDGSPRGGILTHASVLKVTANGTVTSPVTRGNFVLTSILGDPPNPPPPNAGSIEPDTRGTTTIRETLNAHRDIEQCARCHRAIDPPGFALECFDPIGGFRTRYRANPTGIIPKFNPTDSNTYYSEGLEVDASGVTQEGRTFTSIEEFKQLLLNREDQVAKHVVSQLVVYATGSEIQFADREQVDAIIETVREHGYPLRTIIHEIVQSHLFRNM